MLSFRSKGAYRNNEDGLLADCYKSCYGLAKELGVKSIAFPSISTGAYGFPLERAAQIALQETKEIVDSGIDLNKILFVCFGEKVFSAYHKIYSELF